MASMVARSRADPAEAHPSLDRDTELRENAARVAVDLLSHQLDVERDQRAKVQSRELLVTSALLGGTFGIAYAVVRSLKPRALVSRVRRRST